MRNNIVKTEISDDSERCKEFRDPSPMQTKLKNSKYNTISHPICVKEYQ